MKCKKACLVINPRAGQNLTKLADVIAVLSAAGWKTDVAIKEYGGHTMKLARKGARNGDDLVVGYGGDGTLNQVINGVMNSKGQRSVVGVIPGGTANVWAGEVGVPLDPVAASLGLVNSEARKIDVGHVEVGSLTFLETPQDPDAKPLPIGRNAKKVLPNKLKPGSKASHHFLLMAGLGIDAAIMEHVSKPLKYETGRLAVGIAAAKELPAQRAFPIEIRSSSRGGNGKVLWKGEALQVVVGNTRRYGGVVEMTPDAHIDDGVLNVCVITAGDPLTTMEQIISLLWRRKPSKASTEYFHGAHLSISVPASIGMQLDGSPFDLKDYLSKTNWKALQQRGIGENVMVNYHFDAMPHALKVAIPYTYDDSLFEDGPDKAKTRVTEQQQVEDKEVRQQADGKGSHSNGQISAEDQRQAQEHITALLNRGCKVTVVGASPNPEKKKTYIIAGVTSKKTNGEYKPVAVRIDGRTKIFRHTGERLLPAFTKELKKGGEIVIQGKQSKRGVIRAKGMVVI